MSGENSTVHSVPAGTELPASHDWLTATPVPANFQDISAPPAALRMPRIVRPARSGIVHELSSV